MDGLHHEGLIIRPPSEAESLILQVTRGCSHNKCSFCGTYKGVRFRIQDPATIAADIRYAAAHLPMLKRVFLADGDALILPQPRLLEILQLIRRHLPWVQRVGLYGNAKSIWRKTPEELDQLHRGGLGIVYLGVESGDPQVLARICKGVSAERMIAAGRRVRDAGIKLSVTVLLGIAGRNAGLRHARATGEVLTAMDPNYVGALTLMILPNTPLAEEQRAGRFELPAPPELLEELREMLRHTELSQGLFLANHASNYLPLKVRLPAGKDQALALIDRALAGAVALKPEWLRAL